MVKAAEKKAKERAKIEHYTTQLKCVLKPHEIAERADRCAQLVADMDSKEADMKAAQKHAKSVIETIGSAIRTLSEEVRSKSTYRGVEVQKKLDYLRNFVSETRLDTGEIVSERGMTEAERQRELPFEEADGKAKGKAKAESEPAEEDIESDAAGEG